MRHLLDNIFWHALSGPQARFAAGDHANTGARRLYERMGFRNYKETVVRVISCC